MSVSPGSADMDAFFATRLSADLRPLADRLRALVAETVPHADERLRYGIPMWTGHGHVCYLSPNARGLTFGFPYGTFLPDPHGILGGDGKTARNLLLRPAHPFDEAALRGVLAEAAAFDLLQPVQRFR